MWGMTVTPGTSAQPVPRRWDLTDQSKQIGEATQVLPQAFHYN